MRRGRALLCRGGLDILDPAGLQEFANIARCLPDTLLILDQRNPDMPIALLPKSGTRRDGHMCFIDQL